MAKPIPVFSFVFAAYAATSTADFALKRTPFRELRPCDPFAKAWRVRATRGGALIAKVCLLKVEPGRLARLASANEGETDGEIWLEDIAETRLGFIGTARSDQRPSSSAGQRIRFHGVNVRDWRFDENAPTAPAAETPGLRRDARGMLAGLTEIVGA